jgi:hypothetical protein
MQNKEKKPSVFNEKKKKTAELVAYLTGGVPLKDDKDGTIRILCPDELNEMVTQKYAAGDFITVSNLAEERIKTLDKFSKIDQDRPKIIKKSIRLPFPTFLRIVAMAFSKNTTISGTIGEILKSEMKNFVDDYLSNIDKVIAEHLSDIKEVINGWGETTESRAGREYYGETWDFEHIDERIVTAFRMLVEKEFFRRCSEFDIPEEAAKAVWSRHNFGGVSSINFGILVDADSNLSQRVTLTINSDSEDPELTYSEVTDRFGENIIDSFRKIIFYKDNLDFDKKLFEDYVSGGSYDSPALDIMYSYIIELPISVDKEDNVYLGKTRVLIPRGEITDECMGKINSEILGKQQVDRTLTEEMKKTIASQNYKKVAELSKELAFYQASGEITGFLIHFVLKGMYVSSDVASFLMPSGLELLWEALKENRDIPQIICKHTPPEIGTLKIERPIQVHKIKRKPKGIKAKPKVVKDVSETK